MRLVLAYLAVYVIWGSTYLAIRVGIETLAPAAMLGARFLIAGALNLALARLFAPEAAPPSATELRNAALVGTGLLIGGTGLVGYAEQTVDSHLAAIIVSTVPIWVTLIDSARSGRIMLERRHAIGMALGFGGVMLVSWPGLEGGAIGADRRGVLLLLLATGIWTFFSSYAHHAVMPRSIWLNAGVQMLTGGTLLLAWAALRGELTFAALAQASVRSIGSMVYLALFGSTVAFTAYAWLLRVEPTARVATYALVNPLVAVLLGAWLGQERVTLATAGGLVLILVGLTVHMRLDAALRPPPHGREIR